MQPASGSSARTDSLTTFIQSACLTKRLRRRSQVHCYSFCALAADRFRVWISCSGSDGCPLLRVSFLRDDGDDTARHTFKSVYPACTLLGRIDCFWRFSHLIESITSELLTYNLIRLPVIWFPVSGCGPKPVRFLNLQS
jgi:hypothetical protein